jgi:3-isopropylmalate/(R)-2-methylmalate dehydratase small subunit
MAFQSVTTVNGIAVPFRRNNVDTDQIIPAVYMKRITRTGFEEGLFASWRRDPNFVLNRPEHAGANILIAGPDFGTGSSREHAVWALMDYASEWSSPPVSPTSSEATQQSQAFWRSS